MQSVGLVCVPRKSRGSTGKGLPPITKVRSTGLVHGMLGEIPASTGSREMEVKTVLTTFPGPARKEVP